MTPIPNRPADQFLRTKLGSRILEARKQKGFSQTTLGGLAKIHISHISKIERGQANMTLSTLLALATALDTTPFELLHGISASDFRIM